MFIRFLPSSWPSTVALPSPCGWTLSEDTGMYADVLCCEGGTVGECVEVNWGDTDGVCCWVLLPSTVLIVSIILSTIPKLGKPAWTRAKCCKDVSITTQKITWKTNFMSACPWIHTRSLYPTLSRHSIPHYTWRDLVQLWCHLSQNVKKISIHYGMLILWLIISCYSSSDFKTWQKQVKTHWLLFFLL
jgi:hypothetical protein